VSGALAPAGRPSSVVRRTALRPRRATLSSGERSAIHAGRGSSNTLHPTTLGPLSGALSLNPMAVSLVELEISRGSHSVSFARSALDCRAGRPSLKAISIKAPRSSTTLSHFRQIATRLAVGDASTDRSGRASECTPPAGRAKEDLEVPRRQRPRGGVVGARPGRQKQVLLRS
jgi:hypothetical protein